MALSKHLLGGGSLCSPSLCFCEKSPSGKCSGVFPALLLPWQIGKNIWGMGRRPGRRELPFPYPRGCRGIAGCVYGDGSALGPPTLFSLPLPIIHEAGDGTRGHGRVGVAEGLRMTSWSLGIMKRVDMVAPHRMLLRSPARNAGATGPLPQDPFLGPMALVMQPQRPQGTLTVCWSRHGWQVYWKLANWQYLRGPQSSSMMHSWVGGEQLCQERQVSKPTVSRKCKALYIPQSWPHRLRAQDQSPDAPQCPSTLSPAQLAPWYPAPNLHPVQQGPHPHSTPQLLPCRMPRLVHTTASLYILPSHTQGGEHRARPHFSAEQMGLIKELMSSRPRWLHRRGWSLSQAGPAD